MKIYHLHVSGMFTGGTFELHAAETRPSPVMSTGPIPVASDPEQLRDILAEVLETVVVHPLDDSSSKATGPKSWVVFTNGNLWTPQNRNFGLYGMSSPDVKLIYQGVTP